jgi:hypothetical protein
LLSSSKPARMRVFYSGTDTRRVTEDPEGPFCPMKVGTARGFVTTDYHLRNSGQTTLFGHSQIRTTRTKRRNESLSTGRWTFVKRQTSVKDWPVFSDYVWVTSPAGDDAGESDAGLTRQGL